MKKIFLLQILFVFFTNISFAQNNPLYLIFDTSDPKQFDTGWLVNPTGQNQKQNNIFYYDYYLFRGFPVEFICMDRLPQEETNIPVANLPNNVKNIGQLQTLLINKTEDEQEGFWLSFDAFYLIIFTNNNTTFTKIRLTLIPPNDPKIEYSVD